jgi:hypothetical protein
MRFRPATEGTAKSKTVKENNVVRRGPRGRPSQRAACARCKIHKKKVRNVNAWRHHQHFSAPRLGTGDQPSRFPFFQLHPTRRSFFLRDTKNKEL